MFFLTRKLFLKHQQSNINNNIKIYYSTCYTYRQPIYNINVQIDTLDMQIEILIMYVRILSNKHFENSAAPTKTRRKNHPLSFIVYVIKLVRCLLYAFPRQYCSILAGNSKQKLLFIRLLTILLF